MPMVLTLMLESSGCGLYHALRQDEAGLPPSEPLPSRDTDVPYFLIGDEAFSLRSWMMKPHSKREN